MGSVFLVLASLNVFRKSIRLLLFLPWIIVGSDSLVGQELEPRAYLTLPVGVNFFAVAYGRSTGNVIFDPTLPVEDVRARVNSAVLGYARGIDFFGRSASLGFATPYVGGN